MNETQALNLTKLGQFTGTENYYKHWTPYIVLTDGVQFLGANGMYWLIDVVASTQTIKKVASEPLQVWKLTVNHEDNTALVTCNGADYETGESVELYRQEIPYTDCPLSELKLYAASCPQFKRVLMLTSEY